MERTRHFEGLLIVLVLIGLGGLYLWQNGQPSVMVSVPAATPTPSSVPPADWQVAIETQLDLAGTVLPTPDMAPFVPPTLPPASNAAILDPGEIVVTPWPTPTFRPTLPPPTPFGPTPFPSPTGLYEDTSAELGFQPLPEEVPLSLHVNDHYWLMRPVDASANSESIFFYPYGSDGPSNEWRVHHGIDIPNDVGEAIHAGGSGKVIFAGDGGTLIEEGRELDVYPSYGLAVVIEHDFSYRGQKIYTLYAHMAAILVEKGQYVQMGDIIGLIGGTGDVSGPHVHLEVRLGENKYFSAYNPLLWVVPYLERGVVAGRVTGTDGQLLEDWTVTLTRNNRVSQTTTTYIAVKRPDQYRDWHTLSDPGWQENFVMSDVPEGEYVISVNIFGQPIRETITVKAGTTTFVTLGWDAPATPQPVENDGS
jgi:murein DD-endopeptidase MepM/ murein hydrolase activator NlpD